MSATGLYFAEWWLFVSDERNPGTRDEWFWVLWRLYESDDGHIGVVAYPEVIPFQRYTYDRGAVPGRWTVAAKVKVYLERAIFFRTKYLRTQVELLNGSGTIGKR